MKGNLIIFIVVFIGFIQSCKNSQSINQSNLRIDSLSQTKSDSIDNHEIIEANKKFKISDLVAIRLVRQIKDFRDIIDWKYKDDSTIINVVSIDGVPNDTNPDWTIMISQYQPRIPISNRILTIIVNANDGNIRILDIPKDTILTLDSWKKQRNTKK